MHSAVDMGLNVTDISILLLDCFHRTQFKIVIISLEILVLEKFIMDFSVWLYGFT